TAEELIVLPNPGNGLYTLKGYGIKEEEYDITIVNTIGQIVLSKKIIPTTSMEVSLNISEYAAGTYLLYATSSSKSVVKKIIKQ
ncbi:MAG: T9SS type A sorting domain-containing protein, partial [Cytophagales bacterium]|nr:T9SS type A sorting domain-containing protein [Cytophaga sp.]